MQAVHVCERHVDDQDAKCVIFDERLEPNPLHFVYSGVGGLNYGNDSVAHVII